AVMPIARQIKFERLQFDAQRRWRVNERDRAEICFFSSRRRHTRCYRDWSSDVCSSDLHALGRPRLELLLEHVLDAAGAREDEQEIGRASCRERVEMWVVRTPRKKEKWNGTFLHARENESRNWRKSYVRSASSCSADGRD